MKTVNKIIALVLIASMLFPALIGCNKDVVGGGSKDETIVLKVGNSEITRDMYNYFANNFKQTDDELTDDEIFELSINAIKKNVALEELAKEWGVEFTEEDEKTLDEYVQNAIDNEANESGSTKEYYENLDEHFLTGNLFRYLYKMTLMEDKLREYAYAEQNNIIKSDDATLNADIEKNFYAAKQILIITDTGEDEKANEALANSVLAQIQAGGDFDGLAATYSEDRSIDSSYIYYFTKGQLLEEFEAAVMATAIGEVYPSVVKSAAGYHIIKRMPLEQQEIESRYEELRSCYKARCFNEILQAKMDSYQIEKTENFQ